MKTTKEKFLNDVKKEVELLKIHATKNELNNLDFEKFHPNEPNLCIYGQLAGSCENLRAKELMDLACTKIGNGGAGIFNRSNYNEIDTNLNIKYEGQMWTDINFDRTYKFLSYIEIYIFLEGASPKNIIAYLKGITEELELPLA